MRGPAAPAGAGERKRDGARSTLVWDVLRGVVAERAARSGRAVLDIVDVGGGTGGFAVPFAALGHRVTVVDPSPDALAAAQRRAAEMRVTLAAVQGDADELASLVGDGAADLVICHSVLEYVDSPADAMAAIARVLRPGATYLSQQIGAGSNRELTDFMMGPQPVNQSRSPLRVRAAATEVGLEVVRLEACALRVEFFDVAAVVHFLRKVPWTVPGFSADAFGAELRRMHDLIRRDGAFVSTAQRLLIEARRPG